MDHEGHYAEALYVEPGKRFRVVTSSKVGSQGSPTHRPNPVEFRGRFRDGKGKWHDVWSCMDQAGDLSNWKRVTSKDDRQS